MVSRSSFRSRSLLFYYLLFIIVDVFPILSEDGGGQSGEGSLGEGDDRRASATSSLEYSGDVEACLEGVGHGSEGMHGLRRTVVFEGVYFLPPYGIDRLSPAL